MTSSHAAKRNVIESERGVFLVIVALSMTTLMGFMGLALDVGVMYHHRRLMQTAADSAAMAGASEIHRKKDTLVVSAARRASEYNYFAHNTGGINVTVNNPPLNGDWIGIDSFVEVIITDTQTPTFFMKVLGWDFTTVRARAVAGTGGSAKSCMYILDPSGSEALYVQQNATLKVTCGIQVNSSSMNAVNLSGNATIDTPSLKILGDINDTSSSGVVPPDAVSVGLTPEPDPLAYLQPPPGYDGGCNYTNFQVSGGTHTLSPGVYCGGIKAQNGAILNLNPGYYILKGGIKLESSSQLIGNGVMFYLMAPTNDNKGLSFDSTTQVRLTSPVGDDPYKGILFFQDKSWTEEVNNNFQCQGNSYFEGALYFPNQRLRIEAVTSSTAQYGFVVAKRVSVEGNANFTLNNDWTLLNHKSPLKKPTLVE